jgi:hypothetical protein
MLVRRKHIARLMQCTACGFIFAKDPHWLAEAYAEPINRSDTGYVWRNIRCRERVCSLLEASPIDGNGKFLDYAAGYGMFVRLMRDSGYDFRWADAYCQNLFSRGFEADLASEHYEAVTAFEILEHLPNPLEEVKKLAKLATTLIFTTTLLPEPAPQPDKWWYYAPEYGQHIAFYSRRSLECLAEQIGYHLNSNVDFHVLSSKDIRFEVPPRRRSRIFFWQRSRGHQASKRPSLIQPDHETMVKQTLEMLETR